MPERNLWKSRSRMIAEFMLVVLGVLVALMVDTWMEQRDDDSLRQEYLARLADDLLEDRQALEYRIMFFGAVRSYGLQTLEQLQSDGPVAQDAIAAAYYAAENFAFKPIGNTYGDLQSTGNIRLIGDMKLRLALASYHGKSATAVIESPNTYRRIVRGVIPLDMQALIREQCPTTDDTDKVPTGFPPCLLPEVSREEASTVFSSLRAHADISEILTYRVSQVDVILYMRRVQKDMVDEVLALL